MKVVSFRSLRIVILIGVLGSVVVYSQSQRSASRNWYDPLPVHIYPINGDGTGTVERYIDSLTTRNFSAINGFLEREAPRYDLHASPLVDVLVEPRLDSLPPERPEPGAGLFAIALWSLKLRYWAWEHGVDSDADAKVDLFVIYHDGYPGRSLGHSLGLQKGLVGVVHAFADSPSAWQNNIVIAHELLHTVGATDKYDSEGNPVFPDGYARPDREPLYPQDKAEIMAGKLALSEVEAVMPDSLGKCMIGETTAREINWTYNTD